MRIKLDENLPLPLVTVLEEIGHDAEHVRIEGLTGKPDDEVWRVAQEERRFLVTQDVRFVDARMFRPGTHSGLMLVRLNEPSMRRLSARLREVFTSPDASTWPGALVIVSDHKIRVRRG